MNSDSGIPRNRQEAIKKARRILQEEAHFLDTETTGITNDDVVIEIALVSFTGDLIYNSLIKPIIPIPTEATQIHGVTNEMVKTAPFWSDVWWEIQKLLLSKPLAAYNSDFDQRLLRQTSLKHSKVWPLGFRFFDIMKIVSEYMGIWNANYGGYRYFKLEDAGRSLGISIPNSHRAAADASLAREIIFRIASE